MKKVMEDTVQRLVNGDARDLSFLADESVHLAVTSPPYWNLKEYNRCPGQIGHMDDYEEFLGELDKVWREVYRLLVPGGRLVCVVGDICVSRRSFGRHMVFPLHSDICVLCRKIGFDNLNPIIWHKIANATLEVENGSKSWASHTNRTPSSKTISSSFSCSANRAATGSRRRGRESRAGSARRIFIFGSGRYGCWAALPPGAIRRRFRCRWQPGW